MSGPWSLWSLLKQSKDDKELLWGGGGGWSGCATLMRVSEVTSEV